MAFERELRSSGDQFQILCAPPGIPFIRGCLVPLEHSGGARNPQAVAEAAAYASGQPSGFDGEVFTYKHVCIVIVCFGFDSQALPPLPSNAV